MKQKLAIIAAIFFLTFGLIPNLRSQWVLTQGRTGKYSLAGVKSFAMRGENLYASCLAHGGVFHTTDNGTNWSEVHEGLTSDSVYALGSNGTDLFSGGFAGVCRLNGNDTSWTQVDDGLHSGYIRTLFVNGSSVFASLAGHGVFVSTNNGTSWIEANTGLRDTNYICAFAVSGSNLFAATFSGIFLSTDNGKGWKAVNNGLSDTNVYALATIGTNLFAGTYKGIFLSTDNGNNWKEVDTGLTDSTVLSFAVSGTNIFAGTNSSGVFISTNNGTNWSPAGLNNEHIFSLFASDKYLFAGGYINGAWRRPLSDFGIAEVKNPPHPDLNISLSPNPTTGIITVHNASANILHVTVSSILGESVLELEHPNAPEFTIDLSKLLAGMYYARIVGAHSVSIEKIFKE